jgi:signal transduction histidine kinase/ActR/RegA family two-component response regulator
VLQTSGLREVDAVANALGNAAAQIRQRTEERDRHEAALGELNATLEERVAARTAELAAANAQLASEVAERKRAEEALAHAQKLEAVGQLTGGIAHDFNNLLTAVIGSLELLESRLQEPALKLARNARRAAERGAKLTQQLLAFSRRQRLQPSPTDLNGVIAGMADMLHHTVGGRIGITTALASDLWPAQAEAQQVELCLLNLAINARDAMPEGGQLRIETANERLAADHERGELPAGDYVRVTVADTGIGMNEEARRRVFEPFFTTKPIGRGSGLGLPMVYGTFRQLGGDVRIASRPGAGTAVTLYLPRAVAGLTFEPSAASGGEADLPSESPDAARILLVDDDDDVRPIIAEMLRVSGYRVTECRRGPEALRLLASSPAPDLLLVDYAMPGMSGGELLRRARGSEPELPSIIVTGFAEFDRQDELDGIEILRKPVPRATLIAAVERALGGRARPGIVIPLRPASER